MPEEIAPLRWSILTIRNEQMQVFSEQSRQQWEDRMTRYIERDFPSRYQEIGDAGARQLIRRAVDKGGSVGIDTEAAVAGLLELMIAFGEEFELSPDRVWANRMLANGEAPAELRIALIRERMMARTEGRIVVPYKFTKTPRGN